MYLMLTYDYRNKIIFPHINGVDLIAMFDLFDDYFTAAKAFRQIFNDTKNHNQRH